VRDSRDHVEHIREHGYAVVRGVFAPDDVSALAAAFDNLHAEASQYSATYRHQNFLVIKRTDAELGSVVRMVQWPSYRDAVFARYRVDPRLFELVAPLLGRNLKQIINECIWKPPASTESGYLYHQDGRFRRPASAYRDIATSYVQTYLAIDRQTPDNGCLRVCPGSHRRGLLPLNLNHGIMDGECDDESLLACGLDPSRVVDLHLEPGDVVLWTSFLVHGSHRNRSRTNRRTYVNGFVTADKSDRGEWAFRDGEPCTLREPVLVQYDDLHTRPEPHYVNGAPFPFRRE
jgi:ectoine hydroxylase-related dioxygenase (phytanoyl-CoA dioxygenase family)